MSQSTEPRVLAVMLVDGRPAMVERAIRCYAEQTYLNRRLFVLDTGEQAVPVMQDAGIYYEHMPALGGATIGRLRNQANAYALPEALNADIICHWDSDDWSHPRRIEEQVAVLTASGKQCVGYNTVMFWNESPGQFCGSWEYRNNDKRYCIGASLAYRRDYWESNPFKDLPERKGGTGEDTEFIRNATRIGVSSIGDDGNPRLVCSIHGANTQDYSVVNNGSNWKRTPDWDLRLREVMKYA